MAIKKNKDGIMAAISAATTSAPEIAEANKRAQRTLPKGTIGSVRAGLGGIQEIDTNLILPWGPNDRIDPELTVVNSGEMPSSLAELAASIEQTEQQVPVLLRPAIDRDGHFEVVYGRRRILACRQLDIPVKALIRTLDDNQALMAKGLENASRKDLSYYERVRFAAAILEQGYDRSSAMQALCISKNTLSQLERISRLIPDVVGNAIGAAPLSGRPRWTMLAEYFEKQIAAESNSFQILDAAPDSLSSDEKLIFLLDKLKASRKIETDIESKKIRTPVDGVKIKTSKSSIAVSVDRSGEHSDFAEWLDNNLDELFKEQFTRFQSGMNSSGSSS